MSVRSNVSLPPLKEIGYITKKVNPKEKTIWINHYLANAVAFEAGSFIFVEMYEHCFIPFEVLGAEAVSDEQMKINISDYEDIFQPHTASKKNVSIEAKRVSDYARPDAILMIEGFDLFAQKTHLGLIKSEVYTKAGIRMLLVEKDEEEMHIPYHHEMLVAVDSVSKRMTIQLPLATP